MVAKSLSVVIVTWNSADTIEGCLQPLTKSGVEVIVVDNASNDDTAKLVKKIPTVKLLQNQANIGYGRAANQGVAASGAEFIFLLNPDTEIRSSTLEELKKYLISHPEVGVVGPKLIFPDGTLQREIGPFPNWLNQVMILLRLHRIGFFSKIVYPDYDETKEQEVENIIGAAVMLPRKVFEQVGGFDEKFFLWFEDTDLLKRISLAGYKIVYYPTAVVEHKIGSSTSQVNRLRRQTWWNKSLIHYSRKHLGWFSLILLLPFILLSYLPAAVLALKDSL